MTLPAASAASTAAEKASQQYLECRRKVTTILEEINKYDASMEDLFTQLTRLQSLSHTKSIGTIQVTIVEASEKVPGLNNAAIMVHLDREIHEEVKEVESKEISEEIEPSSDASESVDEIQAEEDAEDEIEKPFTQKIKGKIMVVKWGDEAAFPATILFDPVLSREAVVTITISDSSPDENDLKLRDDGSVLKEIEIPVSSLIEKNVYDEWIHIKVEVNDKADDNVHLSSSPEVESTSLSPSESNVDASAEEPESIDSQVEDSTSANTRDEKIPKLHVQARYTISESEAINLKAIALARKKQEAESSLEILENDATLLRSKYERLSAVHRTLLASNKTSNLMERIAANKAAAKTPMQQLQDSIRSAFTPERRQIMFSFAMFLGSAALFHFQGEKLLA
uniref:Uncharacterized protein AlNc14C463G11788 n=1 Tax=Albugo laibachii Nc14 TaxID=890382 RepID=F0X050_9STRA|nr:conserved hypothetical protein [Albugo laibachii Nc14]|eukprot:CCA27132.1 conserved hypothetical protein [Albugo laibachii Nc14]